MWAYMDPYGFVGTCIALHQITQNSMVVYVFHYFHVSYICFWYVFIRDCSDELDVCHTIVIF